ncbi:MAG: hypothetical protein KDE14_13810, partial [Rhodobacteraceae bacterium]|nr:hypothetical protein [Paracoccaceae bacterium]
MPTLTQGRAVMALAALVAYSVSDTRADDQTENTQLAEAPVIEEIVVTASPIASDQGKLATIVGQVDRADILESGG